MINPGTGYAAAAACSAMALKAASVVSTSDLVKPE